MTLFYEDQCLTCKDYIEYHESCDACDRLVCDGRACRCQTGGDAA